MNEVNIEIFPNIQIDSYNRHFCRSFPTFQYQISINQAAAYGPLQSCKVLKARWCTSDGAVSMKLAPIKTGAKTRTWRFEKKVFGFNTQMYFFCWEDLLVVTSCHFLYTCVILYRSYQSSGYHLKSWIFLPSSNITRCLSHWPKQDMITLGPTSPMLVKK